jgi:lysozyme
VKGLDVSHWNPNVDFGRAAELGVRFVFIKASQGLTMRDDHFATHAANARAAGIAVGAYHFFDYRKDGRRQARHFLGTLRSSTGLDQLLPLVVDVETLSTLGRPNRARARARLHALLDELYRQTGRYPMIYTSRHMWKQVVGEPLGFGSYPLWVACWKCETLHMPRGWSSWRFWQFGQFRFGRGLPRLDGNVYSASTDRLRRERERVARLDGGAEWATAQQVDADLRGYQGKDVRVALDDGPFGAWRPFEPTLAVDLGKAQGAREVRLQLRSFRNVRSPTLRESIRLDSVAPAVRGPRISLQAGMRLPRSGKRVPVVATMSAADATSGLDRTVLAAACGGVHRARSVRPAAGPDLEVDLDRTGCTLKARATDRVGHTTSRALDPRVELIDVRRRSERITFRGAWRTTNAASAIGRSLTRTSGDGASASLRFEGAQIAVVARRSPSSGKLDVSIDGKHVARVDLDASSTDDRRVVFVGNVSRGPHTLRLRASGSAVALDAVLVLDRRR